MKAAKIFISSTFKDMNAERNYLNEHVIPGLKQRVLKQFGIVLDPIDLRWGVTEQDALKGRALEICLHTIDECRPFFICILGQRYGWVPPLNAIAPEDFGRMLASDRLSDEDKLFIKKHYARQEYQGKVCLYSLAIDCGDEPMQYLRETVEVEQAVLDSLSGAADKETAGALQPIAAIKDKQKFLTVYSSHPDLPIIERIVENGYAMGRLRIDTLSSEDQVYLQTNLSDHEYYKRVVSHVQGEIGFKLQQCCAKAGVPRATESITEKEIRHAVLNNEIPLSIPRLDEVLHQAVNEKKVLTSDESGFIRRCYPGNKLQALLTEEELVRLVGVLQKIAYTHQVNSIFFIRKEPGGLPQEYKEQEAEVRRALDDLTAEVRAACNDKLGSHRLFEYSCTWNAETHTIESLEEFGELVSKEIWNTIELQHKSSTEAVADEKDQEKRRAFMEDLAHENFAANRTRNFVGREEILKKLHARVEAVLTDEAIHQQSPFILLMGDPGGGKSAICAKLYQEFKEKPETDVFTLVHFIGAGERSTNPRYILIRLCRNLKNAFGFDDEIPSDLVELGKCLDKFLEQAPKKVVLIIDAINQVDKISDGRRLLWLPRVLPKNVCMVVSAIDITPRPPHPQGEGEKDAELRNADCEALDNMRMYRPNIYEIRAEQLNETEKRDLVCRYLDQYRKIPEPEVLDAIVNKPESYNPLFLTVAAEELRLFGSFERIKDFSRSLPGTVVGIFDHVLQRLEAAYPGNQISEFLAFTACGKSGMHRDDLKELLLSKGEEVSDYKWADMTANMAAYMMENENVFDFFHQQFKEAAGRRYLATEEIRRERHAYIAAYLKNKGYSHLTTAKELAHQLYKAGKTEELKELLLTYQWIWAKLVVEDVQELLNDYELEEEPEEDVKLIKAAILLSAHVLEIDKSQLPNQLHGRLLNNKAEPIGALLQSASHNTQNPWLRPLTASLLRPGNSLVRILRGHADAVNGVSITADGSVAVSVSGNSTSDESTLKVWDLKKDKEIHTFRIPTGSFARHVELLSVTADGSIAVFECGGLFIWVWDLKKGTEIHTLKGKWDLKDVCITPDGSIAVCAYSDATLKVWDLKKGAEIHTLGQHSFEATRPYWSRRLGNRLSMAGDGSIAVSVSWDYTQHIGILKVWDLKNGTEIHSFKNAGYVDILKVTADGSIAVFTSVDKIERGDGFWVHPSSNTILKVWNLKKCTEIHTLVGHPARVNGVTINADGSVAISASEDNTLKVWDLKKGTEIHTLRGHTGPVNEVNVTADWNFAISASHDKTLKVWDLKKGIELKTLRGHSASVKGISVSANGSIAVSASEDKTLMVWDLRLPRKSIEPTFLCGHINRVTGVSVNADGSIAVSASEDKTLKVWDPRNGNEIHTFRGNPGVGFRDICVAADGNIAVSVTDSREGKMQVWDLKKKTEIPFKGPSENVNSVSVNTDGSIAVSAGNKTLKVWDLKKGIEIPAHSGNTNSVEAVKVTVNKRPISASYDKTIARWDLKENTEFRTLSGHTASVNGVSVNSDGSIAVSASEDKTLKVWDLKKGTEIYTLSGHAARVNGVSVNSDGSIAASASEGVGGENTLKVWNLKNGIEIHTLRDNFPDNLFGWIYGISITADGHIAVSAGDKTLKVWDLKKGIQIYTLRGHTKQIHGVSVNADGSIAVSASEDKTLKVWDLKKGTEIYTLSGHTASVKGVSVNADGSIAVSASEDITLKVWDLEKGTEIHTLSGHAVCVNGVSVTADGHTAVSAGGDKTLKVWDLKKGTEIHTLSRHAGGINGVSVNSDGSIAVSASNDNTLKMWDLRKCLKKNIEIPTLSEYTEKVNGVSVTPDGRVAVSAGDKTLKVWDLKKGTQLYILAGRSNQVSVSANGGIAVSLSENDNTLKVWDLRTGSKIHRINGHTALFREVSVTADGSIAVSASNDNSLKVWNLKNGKEFATFYADAELWCCAIGNDNKIIVAGDASGTMHFLQLENYPSS